MSVFAGPNIVTDALTLCLDAADTSSYSGSGTAWYDLVGGRTATLLNSPAYDGQSFAFDGVDQALDFASSVEVSTGDGFTICTLIKLPSTQINGTNWCHFISDRDFGAGDYESGIYGTNTTTWIFKENASSPNAVTSFLGTDWVYLCYGQNSSSQPFIYVDGALSASSESTWPSATFDFTRIFSAVDNSRYLKCDCAYFQLYDKGLSVSESFQNFQALRGRFDL